MVGSEYEQFYRTVMEYYGEYGRHDLPWRKQQTPYRVCVSECMLQQTQANRVVDFFNRWMKAFPSWKALAEADQKEVLRLWKGLGYNSRALRLHTLAKEVRTQYAGRLPHDYNSLLKLPGIGPYTASAIRAFAFNLWTPMIETNIRRVYIHHFFKDSEAVDDSEILEYIEDMGPVPEPREWYEALMDYGAQLPKIVKHNPNVKSKQYTKQSTFKGSDRQIRGIILSLLLEHDSMSVDDVVQHTQESRERIENIVKKIEQEGFLKKKGTSLLLV
jgi:A/G-specific adenine glycosylase